MENVRELWIRELQSRLWFLPTAEATARAVLEGDLPAATAAIRWREELPRAFAEDVVDDALVELLLAERIGPVLVELPAVFTNEQAEEALTRLLDASVQDVADRFFDVNEDAVGRVASGLARIARGDDTGEGELAEGLATVLADRERLVRDLPATPELDEVARALADAAVVLAARRWGGDGEA